MRIIITGSGGNQQTPRPGCDCSLCSHALRVGGKEIRRGGPSLFIEDIYTLIDTPSGVGAQFINARIKRLDNIFFTHADPDHTMGMRDVLQEMNENYVTGEKKLINVYIPELVWQERMEKRFGWMLNFYQEKELAKIHLLKKPTKIKSFLFKPIKISVSGAPIFIYVVNNAGKRVVVAPCDLKSGRFPTSEIKNPDLLIIEAPAPVEVGSVIQGVKITTGHPLVKYRYTFQEMKSLLGEIKPKRTIFVHIEESFGLSQSDYEKERFFSNNNAFFSYDGMLVEI